MLPAIGWRPRKPTMPEDAVWLTLTASK
jgi:hypothetical protein